MIFMKMTKRLLAFVLALAVVVTGMLGAVSTQAAAAFTSWTDAEQAIYHLGLENVSVVDGNYTHYRYFAQEFVPEAGTLGGAKLALNLTAGTATVHMELRSEVNGTALATANTNITSKGNGMNWYDISLGEVVTVTPGNVYYLVYWLTARTASSVCVVHGKSGSFDHSAYVWKMSDGGAVNFTKNDIVAGFELITTQVSTGTTPSTPDVPDTSVFTAWEQEGAPITHLGLSTANVTDGNFGNYRYIAQEFVPDTNEIYGADVALNLTQGNATLHMEIREQVNGAPIASFDGAITSQGNGRHWYSVDFGKGVKVTPNKPYYLAYWLTARDAASVCIVYGSDVGAGGATHPGYVWPMADGGDVNFDAGVKYLVFCFRINDVPPPQDPEDIVIGLIKNLPQPADIALGDEDAVVAAREAYDALTDEQKALIVAECTEKLEACEAKIAELKAAAAADQAAAQAVIDQIDALPAHSDVTLEDEADVKAAREAYEALTDAQKDLVTNLEKLEAAEQALLPPPLVFDGIYGDPNGDGNVNSADALEVLKAVVGKIALNDFQKEAADVNDDGKIGADDALMILQYVVGKVKTFPAEENNPLFLQKQADAVDAKIDAIGEITAENYREKTDVIEQARKAYNDLKKEVKDLVTKLPVLQAAEEKWAEFKAIDDARVPQPEDPANPKIDEGYQAIPQLQGVSGYATPIEPIAPTMSFNTLTQINQSYSKLYDLDIDCILAYEYGMPDDTNGGLAASWLENKHTYNDNATIGMMIAVNRDNAEYLEKYAGNRGTADIQTTSNGQLRSHSVLNGKTVYYMVPTNAYLDYKWQVIDKYLQSGKIKVVALEEPELWNSAGYSAGYKELFKQYYGVDWMDPNKDAQSMWMHQKLKAWAFKNAFEVLSGKIKEKYPDVKVLITTHSPLSYMHHGISTGAAMFSSIPTVDGVIGQTWSDDAAQSFMYAGNKIANVFMNAMYAYNSYGELLSDGQTLYLLQDPSSDNGAIPQEEKEENWKQTVVAAMMQNDTTSFQSTIWPQRAFTAMGMDYKTVQLSVNKMYQEFGNDDMYGAVYGATPGIALATSDSMGWHLGANNVVTGNSRNSFSGIYLSLQNDGVALDTVSLDTLQSTDQLKDVNLLIVAYDAAKPLTETANQVIADWVKAGGRLLMMNGYDEFANITREWWGQKGTTPYNDLIAKLGLNVTTSVGGVESYKTPTWPGSSVDDTCYLSDEYSNRVLSFTGSGFETFMTYSGKNVGIQATVGEGYVVMAGLPSAYYATSMPMEKAVRELCAKALKGSATEYKNGTSFVAVRGNYFAYYSPVDASRTAEDRTFVNLLHPNLEVIVGGTAIPRAEAVLYYDVTNQDNDDIPRFCFTGGTETAERFQTADITRFTITNPSNSVAASLLLGNGKYPQKVTAKAASGAEVSFITNWDDYTGALIIKASNPDVNDPITFEVTWGDEYVQLPTNYVYDSFNHFTKDDTKADDSLLHSSTGYASGGTYYCDNNTEFVWRVDLNTYKQASMTFDVIGNYVIQVSFDGKTWETVENWADKGAPVGNLADGTYVPGASNRTDVTVNANNYDASATAQYMYVRLGSCYMNTAQHPGGDHGGSIYSYTLTYLTPAG